VFNGAIVNLGVSGAITALSDPLAELGEIWLKADALLEAIGQEVARSGLPSPTRESRRAPSPQAVAATAE
jgi:hypothetical protein